MGIMRLLYALYKIKLLSPKGLYRLMGSIRIHGINIMMLLHFVERTHGHNIALVDDNESITYKQLLSQSEKIAIIFGQKYNIEHGQKVGFLCKNHASVVKAIFAASRLGVDLYLLNAEMSKEQFNRIQANQDFDFLVYDFELHSVIEQSSYKKNKVLSYHDHLPAINNLLHPNIDETLNLRRTSMSKMMLLTGGTTGKSKEVVHKPSLFNYLNPFLAMLTRLNLLNYKTAYVATPIYHGYGIAVLLLFVALGKKVVISRKFDAERACSFIHDHQVEVVTVVPLMIHKMLNVNSNQLKSVQCFASGGAVLNPKLAQDVFSQLGDVLYNLYGTSEAGLNIIATPKDLKYSEKTIGRKIAGAHLRVLDTDKRKVNNGTIGQLCFKNKWSMTNSNSQWIETGDLGYQDHKGYYFLCGRTDDLVVSAGVNVYPVELEHVLIMHPYVEDVAVIGITDEEFGQRLKAFVQLGKNTNLSTAELLAWLRPKVARYQLPKEIVFVERMPYTSLGKLDKKQLK